MGGGQKALLDLSGASLLTRVLSRLTPQVDAVAISANTDISDYQEYGFAVVQDTLNGHLGPLAGILSGMRWGEDKGLTHILSVAGDTPFFPIQIVQDFVSALSASENAIAMAASPDARRGLLRQPTFALWPVGIADELEAALKEDVRKIVVFAEIYGLELVSFPSEPYDPFFNVNTPDDMQAAIRMVAEFNL